MSTIKDFENAPTGATATHKATGNRVMKVDGVELRWITRWGRRLTDKEVVRWGFTLDPIEPAPTTAREALDLAWELAHEVKEGQAIPQGTRYLKTNASGLAEFIAQFDFKIDPAHVTTIRTVEPLPDPEPDWLDAPAVLASLDGWGDDERQVFTPASEEEDHWVAMFSALTYHWSDLRDVTPLYPKEGQDA